MSGQVTATRDIPKEATARLLRNLETFVRSVQEGLQSGAAEATQQSRWNRASGLLSRDLEAVRKASALSTTGKHEALILRASQLRFLARRMDGYRLDFAGVALGQRLEIQRRLTVLVAWQIFAAGTGSQATGL